MSDHFLYGFMWTLGALGALLAVIMIIALGYFAELLGKATYTVWRQRRRR